jgi:hypothetical protein
MEMEGYIDLHLSRSSIVKGARMIRHAKFIPTPMPMMAWYPYCASETDGESGSMDSSVEPTICRADPMKQR